MLVALVLTAPRVPAFAQNAVQGAQPATAGRVTGIGPYLHLVADLDRSLEFYQAVLGSEPAGTAEARAWGRNEPVAVMYGAPGAEVRTATVPVPGSEMPVELVAFRGVARRRVEPHIYDPGATLLVGDIDAVFAKIKAAGGTPVTPQPVTLKDNRRMVSSSSIAYEMCAPVVSTYTT
jgi:catechol 2,3-dioxygenase-like lactoylglutathione lyase family enzyme